MWISGVGLVTVSPRRSTCTSPVVCDPCGKEEEEAGGCVRQDYGPPGPGLLPAAGGRLPATLAGSAATWMFGTKKRGQARMPAPVQVR